MKRRLLLETTATAAGIYALQGCGGALDDVARADEPSAADGLVTASATVGAGVPVPTTLPSWRAPLAVGQWTAIPNTAPSLAPLAVKTYPTLGATGPAAKVIAWCGLSLDTRNSTLYSAAGGGHSDYAGNEVHAIGLAVNTPQWVERRAATAASQVLASRAYYADGRPTSRHSYYGVAFNEKRGRILLLAGSRWGDGYQTEALDGFNLATLDWDRAGTYPNAPAAVTTYFGAAVVEHKSTGDLYAFANYNAYRWNNATNTWSAAVSGGTIYGIEAASALDSRRNRVLVVGGHGADRGLYTLGSATTASVTLTGTHASALNLPGNGMVYEPTLDAYLVRRPDAGGTVYRINAQTWAVSTFATTGGSSIPAAQNGVYRRWLYVPALGGVVYCPSYTSNLWFLRTA